MTTSNLSKKALALRPYQEAARQAIHAGFEDFDRQLVVMPTGCHAPGHPILMADGTVRAVESIQVGDLVMGPDSDPRRVLELHSGTDDMFRIVPVKGEPFVVNSGHILSLARTRVGKPSEDKRPWFSEISVRDWLSCSAYFRHLHKLRRVPVEFPDAPGCPRRLDPYILGVLLGDGTLHQTNVAVCTPDPEIVAALVEHAQRTGALLRKQVLPNNKASSYYIRGSEMGYANEYTRQSLEVLGLRVACEGKHIPQCYKVSPSHVRAEVLAGLLDTDGYIGHSGYEFSSKSAQLADDVVFVARSLGLAAYQTIKTVNGVDYRRVSISGDCSVLPLRIARKRAPARRQVKDVLVTGFSVEPVGRGTYHGFTLDGDHLYLDGSFTVHHNSGKTVLFSALASDFQPGRTLILAHREELIDQAVKKLHTATGLWAQVEMADQKASPHAPVVVASVQTLARVPRLTRWPKDHFRLVVCDEAHHITSTTWQGVLNYFHDRAKVLGVTATPDRGDKRNLGEYFQNIAFEVSLLDLVRDGWLCPIRVKTVPLGIDLRGVRTTAGDYNADDLGHALDPWLDRIADVLAEHRHRKTIVFLPLVDLSKSFAERCRQRGLAAAHVDGMSPDRAEILDRFRRDELRLLTNAMLLSEGYDEPSIDCVVNLRPTKVRSLYAQQVGRGTRIHPGKDHLLVLDFLFQAGEHKLIRPAHLIARDETHAQELIEALGDEGDLREAEQQAEADRTSKLVALLRNNRNRRSTEVDALELAVALHENALADFVPEVPWHEDPPTPKQIQILKKFGIDPDTVTCKGHASILLDRLFMRRELNLATPKQVRLLRRMGVPNAETIGFEEAHQLLSARFKPASA